MKLNSKFGDWNIFIVGHKNKEQDNKYGTLSAFTLVEILTSLMIYYFRKLNDLNSLKITSRWIKSLFKKNTLFIWVLYSREFL